MLHWTNIRSQWLHLRWKKATMNMKKHILCFRISFFATRDPARHWMSHIQISSRIRDIIPVRICPNYKLPFQQRAIISSFFYLEETFNFAPAQLILILKLVFRRIVTFFLLPSETSFACESILSESRKIVTVSDWDETTSTIAFKNAQLKLKMSKHG